jgi:transaldolase
LEADNAPLPQRLCAANASSTASTDEVKVSRLEAEFRYDLNSDAMATEKLAEGIRNFVADQIKLEQLIAAL